MLDALHFFRHRTNWHKLPGVRRFLCWIGRHDFEFTRLEGQGAVLTCFYCERERRSFPWSN